MRGGFFSRSMRLKNVTLAYIILERQNDFFVFFNDGSDEIYVSRNGVGKIYTNDSSGMILPPPFVKT